MSGRTVRNHRTIGRIAPILWKAVLEEAREQDLNKDGLWDGGSGLINLWASPEDKPSGWPEGCEITRHALDYPRAIIATIWMDWLPGQEVDWNEREETNPIVADIHASEVATWAAARYHDYAPTHPYRQGRVRGDLIWTARQWRKLVKAAEARVPAPLRLNLGAEDGNCIRCGGKLNLIAEVVSSPWLDGVGDWTHYCPTCSTLTLPADQISSLRYSPSLPGVVGYVTGIGGGS